MTTTQQIKHLYWRAGFGLSPKEWQAVQSLSLAQALDALFSLKSSSLSQPTPVNIDRRAGKEARQEARQLQRQSLNKQKAAWIKRMAHPRENALLERMSLFWHGHFACISRTPKLAVQQLNTIRQHALGDFRSLLLAISEDVSMIRFLNNQQNRKNNPNENYARELLELFTMGTGNYSEQDIKAAARAFTGWSSNARGEFVFRRWDHDEEMKTFLGKTGNFNGNDIIDIILARKETALFITRKIYRYFVHPKVDEARVYALAKSFYQSNYDIAHLMRSIFESDWFYASENIGAKIKSPMDLTAGIMRTLELDFSSPITLLRLQRFLGQELFNPPNVAGWEGDRNWIDHATLMMRLNLTNHFVSLSQKGRNHYKDEAVEEMMSEMKAQNFSQQGRTFLSFEPFVKFLEEKEPEAIFDFLVHYLFQVKPNISRAAIEKYVLKNSRSQYIQSVMVRLMSLPEYQMC
ncbi:MAG: DUF1800 domain-containing protein [Bacteroidota bacterium]